jgi:hypothetical protein
MTSKATIDYFRELRTPNDEPLFDLEGIYNISALLDTIGSSTLLNLISERDDWNTWQEFIYSLPEFNDERIMRQIDYENYLNKGTAPVDSNPCPNCGHNNIMVGEQKRAADEAGSTQTQCRFCNHIYYPH